MRTDPDRSSGYHRHARARDTSKTECLSAPVRTIRKAISVLAGLLTESFQELPPGQARRSPSCRAEIALIGLEFLETPMTKRTGGTDEAIAPPELHMAPGRPPNPAAPDSRSFRSGDLVLAA